MSARQQLATEAQMGYINGLVKRLKNVLRDDDETATQLDEAAHATLSKRDASDLIQAMIGALDRIGEPQPREVENGVKRATATKLPSPGEIAYRRRLEEAEAARARYNDSQLAQFGGKNERPEPDGDAVLKIWKRFPNQAVERYWVDVLHGWRWRCHHPSHKDPVNGGSQLGRDQTIANAQAHWEKRHGGH